MTEPIRCGKCGSNRVYINTRGDATPMTWMGCWACQHEVKAATIYEATRLFAQPVEEKPK